MQASFGGEVRKSESVFHVPATQAIDHEQGVGSDLAANLKLSVAGDYEILDPLAREGQPWSSGDLLRLGR